MALPTKTEQETLDIAAGGKPAVCVEAKALTSETLDIAFNGRPAYATTGSSPGGGFIPGWSMGRSQAILGGGLR